MSLKIKFFSKGLLQRANEAAHREKRSRCIDPLVLEGFSSSYVFYVVRMFYHKKNEVRLKVQTDENGSYQFIDVSITRYESLPEIEYLENGEYNVILNKIPYPNGREWQEIEIKKPLRKQDKFRKEILLKYNSCCCVCDIKDKSLLRAAHILAVADGGLDEISNGILLCVNHEIAFDKGLLKILPNYEIEAPNDIGVNVSSLKLPKADIDYPSPVLLEQKMALFNK